jgi:hypothetical protein
MTPNWLHNLCVTDSIRHLAICLSVTCLLSGTSAHCGLHRAIFLCTFDLLALYPSSGSASTVERMSYRRNGRGKWVHTLVRHRIYMLSEITIPQLTSLQSDAGAMRLARRLDCRFGVFQSVGKMHIRHPSCRYGVLCVRRGCPQVPVRVALGDGSPQAGGLPLWTPGLS